MLQDIKIFGLTQSLDLAQRIANNLNLTLSKLKLKVFSDGEMSPNFEETVRGYKIFIVGSTGNSDSILEMLFTIDAARRAGAAEINIVTGMYGYSRQDRKDAERGGIASRVIANCLESTGIKSIMLIDLHASQTEACFMKEVVHLRGYTVFADKIKQVCIDDSWVICTPDAGGFVRAKNFSDKLNLSIVAINKHRDKPNSIGSMDLVGDVLGKNVMIVDDLIDTAGSLVKAVELLLENGAKSVCAAITHGVLSGAAYTRIANSRLTKLYVTNTIPIPAEKVHMEPMYDETGNFTHMEARELQLLPTNKIEVVDAAPVIAEVIEAIHSKESVSALF